MSVGSGRLCVCVCVCVYMCVCVYVGLFYIELIVCTPERVLSWAITLVVGEFKNTNLRINTAENGHILYKTDQLWFTDWVQTFVLEQNVSSLNLEWFRIICLFILGLNDGFWSSTTEIWKLPCTILTRVNFDKEVNNSKKIIIQCYRKLNCL